jgi:aspartate carbamoyltransferase catalytic subunit
MKKTFCDCCEAQCVNTTVMLRIDVVHTTSDGKFVGEDSYKGIEICLDCVKMIKEMMPSAFVINHRDEAMAQAEASVMTMRGREG